MTDLYLQELSEGLQTGRVAKELVKLQGPPTNLGQEVGYEQEQEVNYEQEVDYEQEQGVDYEQEQEVACEQEQEVVYEQEQEVACEQEQEVVYEQEQQVVVYEQEQYLGDSPIVGGHHSHRFLRLRPWCQTVH